MIALTAAQRRELEAIAIETEGGTPLRVCVVGILAGEPPRLAWMSDGGLHKRSFGPAFRTVREACVASHLLNERIFGPAR